MQLELSAEDAAFRDEMRTFFTTKVPQEIRDAVAERRELTKEQIVESQRDAQRRRARRTALARGVGRPRLVRAAPAHLARGDAARLRADPAGVQRLDGRPGDRGVRLPGAEGALPAEDREPRHLVEPGLLRARRRLRPRLAAHHRGPRRRRASSSTARRPGPRSGSTATGSSTWSAPTPRPRSRPASRSCSST